MGISIDKVDSYFRSDLAAPESGVREEEYLLLGEVLEARQKHFRLFRIHLLPGVKGSTQATCVGNVLTQSQSPIDV